MGRSSNSPPPKSAQKQSNGLGGAWEWLGWATVEIGSRWPSGRQKARPSGLGVLGAGPGRFRSDPWIEGLEGWLVISRHCTILLDCSGSHFMGRPPHSRTALSLRGQEVRGFDWVQGLHGGGSERATICRCRDSTLPLHCARDGCETDEAESAESGEEPG
jgi:hypothetical protein